MERSNLGKNLKGHSLGCATMKEMISRNKVKDSWEYCGSESTHGSGGEGDLLCGFSWPPRSYTCSFCKRDFKSAQALGGHMNVHRRDRARLRQYSPPTPTPRDGTQYSFLNLNLNLNPNPSPSPSPNPNPNPNFSSSSKSSSSPSTKFPPFSSTLPPLVSPTLSSLSSPSPSETKKWGVQIKRDENSGKTKTSKTLFGVRELQGGGKFFKKAGIVRLDLEIGVVNDDKEALDLELRLGCS